MTRLKREGGRRAGVRDRLEAFQAQWPSTAPVFVPHVRYMAGVCYSCAERTQPGRFGRCWRCALALRQVWNLLVSDPALTPVLDPVLVSDPVPTPIPGGDDVHPFTDPFPIPKPSSLICSLDQTPNPDLSPDTRIESINDQEERKVGEMKAGKYQSDYHKPEVLRDSGPVRDVIADCMEDELQSPKGGKPEQKLVIMLSGQKVVLNKTNTGTLIDAFGDETDDWIGQEIEAYFDPDVTFGGKRVGGLRIRIPPPDDEAAAAVEVAS